MRVTLSVMPKQQRQLEVGGIYHIVNRGVAKSDIFLKPQDYSRFILALELFNDTKSRKLWNLFFDEKYEDIAQPLRSESNNQAALAGPGPASSSARVAERLHEWREEEKSPLVELLAFCLMPNHFHLVIREIQEGGIAQFMQKVGGYSTYFNKQYARVGPLFQGRYRAVPVETDQQLETVFCYVHTNPIELWEPGWKKLQISEPQKSFDNLREYAWSSFLDYIGTSNFPRVVSCDFFLEYFGGAEQCRNVIKHWIEYKAHHTDIGSEIIE